MQTTVDLDDDVHQAVLRRVRAAGRRRGRGLSNWLDRRGNPSRGRPGTATVAPAGALRYDRGIMKVSISYCKV